MYTVKRWCGDDYERDSGDGSAACDPGICIKKTSIRLPPLRNLHLERTEIILTQKKATCNRHMGALPLPVWLSQHHILSGHLDLVSCTPAERQIQNNI